MIGYFTHSCSAISAYHSGGITRLLANAFLALIPQMIE